MRSSETVPDPSHLRELLADQTTAEGVLMTLAWYAEAQLSYWLDILELPNTVIQRERAQARADIYSGLLVATLGTDDQSEVVAKIHAYGFETV